MRIAQPGFYDIPAEIYHADPCERPSVSSGLISTIVTDTLADAHWKHPRLNPDLQPDDNTKYDLGSVAHTLLLGKGAEIVVIDAADWRKKDTQAERDAALIEGKQPCLVGVYERAQAMVVAARHQLERNPENRDAFVPGKGVAEQAAIWQHETEAGAIFCRAMMDWRSTERPIVWDYKTFAPGADPDGFVKYLFREARAVQDPFYSMGTAALLGMDWTKVEFRFVVQSPNPPFVLSVVQLDDMARDLAWQQTTWALERWARAGRSGDFAGYRPRTHFVAPPSYELTHWEERIAADELADALDARAAA